MSLDKMKPEFLIFKEGRTTDGPVPILSKEGEPFDRNAKINFYLQLGYMVYELDGTEITKSDFIKNQSLEQTAKSFGCSVDQLRNQYVKNLSQLKEIRSRIEQTGKKYRGFDLQKINNAIATIENKLK